MGIEVNAGSAVRARVAPEHAGGLPVVFPKKVWDASCGKPKRELLTDGGGGIWHEMAKADADAAEQLGNATAR